MKVRRPARVRRCTERCEICRDRRSDVLAENQGRRGLEIDYTLADALRRNDPAGFENAARVQEGYRPLVENALDYARQGITSLSEAMRLSGMVE